MAVIEILEAANVDYFLMAGSLLGFSRSNDSQPAWMDSDIDLAVSTSWLNTPGNVQSLNQTLTSAGFVGTKRHKGVDGTATSLGGAHIYARDGIDVELVATDVSPNFFINGFRHEHYRLGCPKAFSKVESMIWGKTKLSVRVPMPFHTVLQATYGKDYNKPVAQQDYESSRMDDVTSTGTCMIVQNLKQQPHSKRSKKRRTRFSSWMFWPTGSFFIATGRVF